MNFPELPGPRASVEILQKPWISRNFPAHPDFRFWGPLFQRFGGKWSWYVGQRWLLVTLQRQILSMFSCKRGHTSGAATLQRTSSGGIILVALTKILVRGDHPNSWKNAPRMQGQMKIFRVGSRQFRESLRELLRELWVSYWSSRERPFREWNFVFREWNFQFRRAAPRIPRNSPGAPRMALSLRERFSWNWGGPQASERWLPKKKFQGNFL